MAGTGYLSYNLKTTERFVKLCASIFGWKDLSEAVVMDVGCGKGLFCARTVLENFPNVKSIIALDCCKAEVEGITINSPKITLMLADIRRRTDIQRYEGKVDKVLSTHVLHQNCNKKDIFKNVHHLLKPGGEAAFLFTSDLGLYHILNLLREDSRYKDYFKVSDVYSLYSSELKADNYREMLEKVGFNVIKIEEERDVFPSDEFKVFEISLHHFVAETFAVPSELVSEIKDSATRLYLSKYHQEKSVYSKNEMSIFVTKPSDPDTKSSSS